MDIEVVDMSEAEKVNLPFDGDTYVCFRWKHKKKKVYFSGTRRGNALEIHIASTNGKKHLDRAVEDFCDYVFSTMPWCSRIVGLILYNKVIELALRHSFKKIGSIPAIWKGENVEFSIMQRDKT